MAGLIHPFTTIILISRELTKTTLEDYTTHYAQVISVSWGQYL
jgi:hypothetical protein